MAALQIMYWFDGNDSLFYSVAPKPYSHNEGICSRFGLSRSCLQWLDF